MRLTAALAVIAATGACANDAPEIKAGACVAKEARDLGDRVPDLTSIVPCTEPHIYEVYALVDLPPAIVRGTGPSWMDSREELALPSEAANDSPRRQAYEEFAEQECATALQRATGYASMRVNGKSAEAVRLIPAMRGVEAPWYTVMPEEQWRDGRHQVVCSARMKAPVAGQEQHTGDDPQLLTIARTPDFPVPLRSCRGYDAERRNLAEVSCDRPHVSELLFFYEADLAMGKEFVRSIVTKPTPTKFNRLDQVCAQALPHLLGKGYDKKDLRAFGSVARRWTQQNKTVRCDVGPENFAEQDLPPGSLVGTNGVNVKLQKAAGS
jgi:hypothetical protein